MFSLVGLFCLCAPAVTASRDFLGVRQVQGSAGYTLHAVNPTAVPLRSIFPDAPAATPSPIPVHTAGEKPKFHPNAPALPNLTGFDADDYPPVDKAPPIDSPEVQGWIAEVARSGVAIPNSASKGGCSANDGTCAWTCNGCLRPSDVAVCPEKLDFGLTFDDGPDLYTPDLLVYLAEKKLQATLFVVGSRVVTYPATLRAAYVAGHQIAIHTWGHSALTKLSTPQVIAELGWARKAIKDVTGVTPLYMRPPYGDIDDRVRAICKAMNLIPVMWTQDSGTVFDTDDFALNDGFGGMTVEKLLAQWNSLTTHAKSMNTGFVALQHDLYQQAVQVAIGYIIPDALGHQPPFNVQPVIHCLNKPMGASYLETNDNSTLVPTSSISSTPSATSAVESPPPAASAAAAELDDGHSVSFAESAYSPWSAFGAICLASVVFFLN